MDLNKLYDLLCNKCGELYSEKSALGKFYNLPNSLKSASEFLKNDKTITLLDIQSDEVSLPFCQIQKKYFEDSKVMYLVLSFCWVKKYDVKKYVLFPDNIYSFAYMSKETDFIITEDLILYSVKGNSVPATVKSLTIVPVELQKILFEAYTDTLIWKDCIRDNFYIPAPIHKLDTYHNKKEYCEKIFRISLPSSANRINFRKLYAVCCCHKYIREENFERLLNADVDFKFYISFSKKKETAVEFLHNFLKARLTNADPTTIKDFINMSLMLKEKVDCFIGKKKLYQLHSEYSKRVMLNAMRGKNFEIPDTPLRYLSLPDNYLIFKTKKAFVVEGTINNNCVASYVDRVMKGKCLCCSADIDGKHFTIEITCRKTKKSYSFKAIQVRGNYNANPEPYIFSQVEEDLKNASPKAIALYNKKHAEKK